MPAPHDKPHVGEKVARTKGSVESPPIHCDLFERMECTDIPETEQSDSIDLDVDECL